MIRSSLAVVFGTGRSPLAERSRGVEKLEDWLAHREIVVQELCPVGTLETLYAQRAALYLWRLNRVTRFEIAKSQGQIEAGSPPLCEEPANGQEHCISPDPSTLQTIIKYEAHLQRCLAGTMAELRRMQKERRRGLRDANPGGRGADRAGICEIEFVENGLRGDSPHLKSSPPQNNSHSKKKSTARNTSRSQRASPPPKVPPFLEAISRRRQLCEYLAGETFEFERNLTSATLDFSIGPYP